MANPLKSCSPCCIRATPIRESAERGNLSETWYEPRLDLTEGVRTARRIASRGGARSGRGGEAPHLGELEDTTSRGHIKDAGASARRDATVP